MASIIVALSFSCWDAGFFAAAFLVFNTFLVTFTLSKVEFLLDLLRYPNFSEHLITWLDSTDSTNSYLKSLVSKSKPPEGTVIFSQHQSQGKGQFDNKWFSPAGQSLALSLLLYPSFLDPKGLFVLNKAVSTGLVKWANHFAGLSFSIKWPNDLYFGEKKNGGILIENAFSNGRPAWSIIGIGVNINQTEFPSDLPNPVSWKQITGKDFEVKDLVFPLLNFLEKEFTLLRLGSFAPIEKDYESLLLGFEETRWFRLPGEMPFSGKILGATSEGQLIIRKSASGTTGNFGFKEIEFIFS